MRVFTVGEFKTYFSKILDWVKAGEKIAITFGKKKEIVAYIVPKNKFERKERPLGLLEGKAKAAFSDDFKITEEEFLNI